MTETTPEAREAAGYPVEERAFHVIRATVDGEVEQFRASDRASLSSFPARDRDDAYEMVKSLNRIVRFHVERALALSPPALSKAAEAEREAKRLRSALETVVSDCQFAIDCLGNSPPEFDAAKRAFAIIRDRTRTFISEVVG